MQMKEKVMQEIRRMKSKEEDRIWNTNDCKKSALAYLDHILNVIDNIDQKDF
jgi:hypothetical protein